MILRTGWTPAAILNLMVPPASPAPQRREGWRLAIPTPADLRRPRPTPASPTQAQAETELADAERAAPPVSDSPRGSNVVPIGPEHTTAPETAPTRPFAPNPGNLPRPAAPPAAEILPKARRPEKARTPLTPNLGRATKKLRHNTLRVHRLPKVEETSAGGVVLDLSSHPARVALIARHDRRARLLWSLPKGHVEAGETPAQAALREVHEETGLIGRVIAPLGVIDFWFVVEDKRIHKTVHHFVIEAIGGDLSDEDIEVEAVEWVPYEQVVRRLAYGDERRLVEKVVGLVPGIL